MATGKRYYWIKLKDSFMSSDTVDFLMSQPNGANYVVLYQMLCLKTINTEGKLSRQIGEIIIPFDIEKIQRDCKWFSADTIRVALKLFQSFGLIYEDIDGTLVLADHQNLVGSETDWSEKKRRQRLEHNEAPALPASKGGDNVPPNVPQNVPIDNRYKDIKILDNRDIEKEAREREDGDADKSASQACAQAPDAPPPSPPKAKPTAPPVPYEKIRELFNSTCLSYSKVVGITGKRQTTVAARWKEHPDLDWWAEYFKRIEASNFLKGNNDRKWKATFDWLINSSNMNKVLEGNYDTPTNAPASAAPTGTGSNSMLNKLREMYEAEGGDD